MKRTDTRLHRGENVRRAGVVTAIAVLAVVTCIPARAQRDGRTVRLASVTELPASQKRFALVIGVDAYEDLQITPLAGAGNDASALAAALVDYAGFPKDQVFLLATSAGERPTRPNILRRLSNLRGVVPKDGLLLVAFSGHGIERGGKGYLLPADAQAASDVGLLEDTAVSVDRMRELIRATGVGQVLLLVDACRNDPTAGKGDSDNPMTAAFSRGFNFDIANREVQAFATLYAAEVGQRAFEDVAQGRGYFSQALVEGLAGKAANDRGEVTLAGLVSWVEQSVPRRIALDLGANKRQRPFATIEGYRAAELILSRAKAPASPPAVAAPVVVDPKAVEIALWNAIESSRDAADFEDYLRRYPTGVYEAVARAKIKQLRTSAEPARPAGLRAPDEEASVQLAPGVRMDFARIQPGTFTMGVSNQKIRSENPLGMLTPHSVSISRGFEMGRHEVTQAQWAAVMGTNPTTWLTGDDLPVMNVAWEEAQEFAVRVGRLDSTHTYRLPTEAEWEYACRAGTTGDHAGNLDALAWYSANSGGKYHPVGTKKPNLWGLYDMHGNVWEWCQDWFEAYPSGSATDPTGPSSGSNKVARGGSYGSDPERCNAGLRIGFTLSYGEPGLGLRLVRTPK